MKKLLCTILAVAMLVSGMTAAFAAEPYAPITSEINENTKFQKEIIIAAYENIQNYDPVGSNSLGHQTIWYLVHSRLIDYDKNTGEFLPMLATEWNLSEDGMTYVFKLRDDVTFHNGDHMTAADVVFSYERAKESSFSSAKVDAVASVEAIDDYTVQFNMATPFADMLYNFAYGTLCIVDKAAVEADPVEGLKYGCGAYYIDSWEFADHTTLKRFDGYWGEMPKTEIFTFKMMPEATARMIALQTGEVDVVFDPPTIEIPDAEMNPDIQVLAIPGCTMNYITMNTTKAPFDNKLVRQAMAYCVNKEDMIIVASEGNGTPAHTFFPPKLDPYTTEEYDFYYPQDLEKAKALLAEAGYADGFEFTFLAHTDEKLAHAQVLQESLKKIGVIMNIEQVDVAALKTAFKEKTYDMASYNWANASGPDTSVRDILRSGAGSNRSHMADEWLDAAMDEAVSEFDVAKRTEQYKEIQKYVMDFCPIIPLYYPTTFCAVKSTLENLWCDDQGMHRYQNCYIVEK